MTAERLYTPELLALAVELARWPARPEAEAHGAARSPTCGSTLALDLDRDAHGRISDLGLTVRACAIGQASAAIFAREAAGQDAPALAAALAEVEAWLADAGPLPAWPGFAPLAPARAFPMRHGALLLPWKAAAAALSTAAPAS